MDVFSGQHNHTKNRTVTPRTNVYLSLYLVIFGFFVVLVNESELSDAKTDQALNSVKQTFFQDDRTGVLPVENVRDVSRKQNDVFVEAKNVIGEILPTAKFFVNAGQNELTINMAANSLFYPNTAAVKSGAKEAMSSLAAMLAARDGDEEVLVTIPRQNKLSPEGVAATNAHLRRANTLAKFVRENSQGTKAVFIGYAEQSQQSVAITIRTQGANARPVL